MSGAAGTTPRKAAAETIEQVLDAQRMLGDIQADPQGPLAPLDPPERARAMSLAAGTLRHLGRIDGLIGRFASRMPKGRALTALRLAAFEMLVDGVPDHAAVDHAVRLVRGSRGGQKASGFVNAVARKLAVEGRAIWPTLAPSGPGPWLGPRLKAVYGKTVLQAMARAHEAGAPLDLTPKTRAPEEVEALAARVGGAVHPTGSIRIGGRVQVSALPGHEEGAWWVQDAAAAIPVRLLGDITGCVALDICAAPGGKTMQLAAAGAQVTALDISERRLARVRENLDRTGLAAGIVATDALNWEPGRTFDVIVLDAPCSATGTLRRHPDLPFVRPEPDLAPLLDLQARLIDRAAGWLKPGGRLVYCTCSLLPDEGEAQVSAALDRLPFMARRPTEPIPGIDPDWMTAPGELRLRPDYWPELGGMDGFFAAVLARSETA